MKSKKADAKQMKLFTETVAKPEAKENFYIAPLKAAIQELVVIDRSLKLLQNPQSLAGLSETASKLFKGMAVGYLAEKKRLLIEKNATYRYANEILESIREVNKKASR